MEPQRPSQYPSQWRSQATSAMALNILEQPAVVQRSLDLDLALPPEWFERQSLAILGCGTSRHAGLVARTWFEAWAQLPTQVYDASEYAEQLPHCSPQRGLILLSQSGQTADVLKAAAIDLARSPRETSYFANDRATPWILGITNSSQTALQGLADYTLQTPAGEERAIAATKSFIAQLILLARLALSLAERRQTLDPASLDHLYGSLDQLPQLIQQTLEQQPDLGRAAERLAPRSGCLILGRGVGHAIALEWALKLKETTYLHAEGMAAGDFMHGPIAMVEPGTPVIAIAPVQSPSHPQLLANLRRIKAYGAELLGVTQAQASALEATTTAATATTPEPEQGLFDLILPLAAAPDFPAALTPMLSVIPLQMLAAEIAHRRGLSVDQPRNLTKFIR